MFARLVTCTTLSCALLMTGCAHSLTTWIVATRDDQGTKSLETQHYKDAARAFHLALQIAPDDTVAKKGFIEAEADLAEKFYETSQFADALDELELARQVDPQDVRVQGLLVDVATARLKSKIVKSNYGSYEETTAALVVGYTALHEQETEILYRIKRFGYTYDTADLSRAIRASTELEGDLSKLTAKLSTLRTLASAGTITPEGANGPVTGSSSSLLPLP